MYLNKHKKIIQDGFSLVEVIIGIMLSSGVLISLTFLMSDIFNQLSYEDVNQKIQSYGNYVLDDISESFKKNNIDRISLSSFDGNSIIRVWFTNSNSEIKYSVDSAYGVINKNNEPIHANNDHMNQHFNDFENKNYTVVISDFRCIELDQASDVPGENPLSSNGGSSDRYGNRNYDGADFQNALYIVDFQMEIYKKIKNDIKLFNIIDFQRTIFVNDEFI